MLYSSVYVFCRETFLVACVNFFAGIFAGFAVFSVLGYAAYTLDTSVDKVIESGPYVCYATSNDVDGDSYCLFNHRVAVQRKALACRPTFGRA